MRPLFTTFFLLLLPVMAWAQKEASRSAVVWYAEEPLAITKFQADRARVRRMVDGLVCAATGKATVAEAWRSLVNPKDRVGIKVAASGGTYFASRPEIALAVVEGMELAGVPRSQMIIWDRQESDLAKAGYATRIPGVRVEGIDRKSGYDAENVFIVPLLGKLIWGDRDFNPRLLDDVGKNALGEENLSSKSYLSRIMAKEVDKVVNLAVLVESEQCGVAGAMYNVVLPNIDNWRRVVQTPRYGDPYLSELYAEPSLGGKVVFHLMDGLTGQYAGGPGFEPNYAMGHGRIYASKDAVALDAVAMREIDAARKSVKLPSIAPRSEYLRSAELMGLGVSTPERIELKQVLGTAGGEGSP